MYTDEAIIRILQKASLECPELEVNKLRGVLEEVLSEYEIQPQSTALVIQDNLQDRIMVYLASKRIDGISEKTLKNYGLQLRRFANFMKKNVEDITTMDLRMYLAVLTKNYKLKNTSLESVKSILKSFFNWLTLEDYIVKSPAAKLKPAKINKKLRGSLNIEEMEILKESCRTLRERAIIETFYATGSRLDEVYKLNRNDIDWQTMSVKVVGKGDKERIVPLTAKAKVHIQKYLLSRTDDCEALFTTEKGTVRRLGHRGLEKVVKKIGERSGLNKNIFPHLLRHTSATIMLNNGAQLSAVQGLLGHTSPATTQIYVDLSNEYVQDQYRKHFVQ
jgi:integrase/recombinase XerD